MNNKKIRRIKIKKEIIGQEKEERKGQNQERMKEKEGKTRGDRKEGEKDSK